MRRTRWIVPSLMLFCLGPVPARAAAWGLDWGVVADAGLARFAGEPRPGAAPAGSLYAVDPPDAVSGGSGLGPTGGLGLAVTLTRKRRFFAVLEAQADGAELRMDDTLSYSGSPDIHRSTAWDWNGLRGGLLLGWEWPRALGRGWAWAPRAALGGWYEAITARQKTISVDGGAAQTFAWNDGPSDDAGWAASLGVDWLRLAPGAWPSRIGVDLRWREGHSLPDPAYGADRPLRAFELVLTVPWSLYPL